MAHLRDRRAFGNIGTRKFRGARFGDALSPRFSGLLDQYPGAAAAYSLRALSSGWLAGDVVEVRPSSGWTPASFTAGQVANGEMVDYVKRPGNFTNLGLETFANNGTGDGFTAKNTAANGFGYSSAASGSVSDVVTIDFDLEIVTGSPALSLRDGSGGGIGASNVIIYATSGSYSGVLTATRNFNKFAFSDGDIPAEFTVSNVRFSTADGFVSTWYDQSGNANNATQATTTAQPKIVSAGALVVGGLDFDGTDDVLNTSVVPPNVATLIGVAEWDTSGSTQAIIGGRDSTNQRSHLTRSTAGDATMGVDAASITGSAIAQNTTSLLFGSYGGSTRLLSTDGSTVTDELGNNPSNTTYGYSLGAINTAGTDAAFMNGKIAEVIVYASDQSANLLAIEANINNQYDIYQVFPITLS